MMDLRMAGLLAGCGQARQTSFSGKLKKAYAQTKLTTTDKAEEQGPSDARTPV